MRLTAILAAVAAIGAAQFVPAPAHATTYMFEDGAESGFFTTGAASPVSGYYLLTDVDFTTLVLDGVYHDASADVFSYHSAYNPVLNEFTGDPFDFEPPGTSGFLLYADGIFFFVSSLSVGHDVTITDTDTSAETVQGPFEVLGVAEPSTWLLMIAGTAMLGAGLRSRSRAAG